MHIIRRLTVPTGDILVVEGGNGNLEMLSLGDYGQGVNLNQHHAVSDDTPIMPLSEKWVVTISTQYGCSMGCEFCDVPKVGDGRNASFNDLSGQIETAMSLDVAPKETKRLNIHFARMGEPSWNPAVIECGLWIALKYAPFHPHPVVSTMMPCRNRWLMPFIRAWMGLKNDVYGGNAGLQISINSTDESERFAAFGGSAHSLSGIAGCMIDIVPKGRKITLNFAVAGYKVDPVALSRLFSPDYYIVKLTPMHKTATAIKNKVETSGDYTSHEPYEELEHRFQKAGYETLVFIASHDEDAGRITCGNAILSGTLPHKFNEVKL